MTQIKCGDPKRSGVNFHNPGTVCPSPNCPQGQGRGGRGSASGASVAAAPPPATPALSNIIGYSGPITGEVVALDDLITAAYDADDSVDPESTRCLEGHYHGASCKCQGCANEKHHRELIGDRKAAILEHALKSKDRKLQATAQRFVRGWCENVDPSPLAQTSPGYLLWEDAETGESVRQPWGQVETAGVPISDTGDEMTLTGWQSGQSKTAEPSNAATLVYEDRQGRRHYQSAADFPDTGLLIDTEDGEDLEVVGWMNVPEGERKTKEPESTGWGTFQA